MWMGPKWKGIVSDLLRVGRITLSRCLYDLQRETNTCRNLTKIIVWRWLTQLSNVDACPGWMQLMGLYKNFTIIHLYGTKHCKARDQGQDCKCISISFSGEKISFLACQVLVGVKNKTGQDVVTSCVSDLVLSLTSKCAGWSHTFVGPCQAVQLPGCCMELNQCLDNTFIAPWKIRR